MTASAFGYRAANGECRYSRLTCSVLSPVRVRSIKRSTKNASLGDFLSDLTPGAGGVHRDGSPFQYRAKLLRSSLRLSWITCSSAFSGMPGSCVTGRGVQRVAPPPPVFPRVGE